MQKAVNKYEKSDDVVFVFVGTWERSEQKEVNAQKIITEKITLLTCSWIMIIKWLVILDTAGNIRFNGACFNGGDEALVEEVSIVIDILRDLD